MESCLFIIIRRIIRIANFGLLISSEMLNLATKYSNIIGNSKSKVHTVG